MKRPVFSIQWHITTSCEQRCQHCYLFNSTEGKKEIAGEKKIAFMDLKKIADNLVNSCLKFKARPRISLTGGNPILHKNFWELLEYLQKLNIKVGILGNPFGITDEIAQKLKVFGINNYQLSIDGMEEYHDLMRKTGSFSATKTAIKILRNNGIKVTIMSTVSKANKDEIPKIIKYVVEQGVDSYAFARYCPTHGDTTDFFIPTEYREFLSSIWDIYSQYVDSKTTFVLKDHLWNLFLLEKGLISPKDTNGVIVGGCALGISHLSVLADGTVYACRRFNSPVGKVPEDNFYKIFHNKKMNEYRNFSRLEKCQDCELLPYCRGCMAVTHGATGKWWLGDPQCWK